MRFQNLRTLWATIGLYADLLVSRIGKSIVPVHMVNMLSSMLSWRILLC